MEEREFELLTGRTVTLRPISFKERTEAEDSVMVSVGVDGSFVKGSVRARVLWVRAGLAGFKDGEFNTYTQDGREYATDETLNQFSSAELSDISVQVRESSQMGSLEKKE